VPKIFLIVEFLRLLFFARALRKCVDPLLVPPPNGRNKPSALRHPLIASAQYAFYRAQRFSPHSGETAMPNTVRLHRVLATKPDKVYRAFIEADAMAKWLPPNGFACTVHHLDAKVGGTYRMSFRNFTTGMSHSFGGKYLELVPGERLRYTDKFEDPNLPGEIQVTVTLRQVSCGTELNIVQDGLPDAIPVEACYLGWQDSLRNLASLVEPEINQ
jgi:uncharacterized protein YndB with AHSA1/START domain